MATCTLRFDQIQIINKRSDDDHSDNDWLIVCWFVGPNHINKDTVPLYNQDGSVILDTGNTLQPVELAIGCADTELVSACIVGVNLGSLDFSEQLNAAGAIGKAVSQKIAEIYLQIAERYVANSGLPLGEVWATGLDKLAPIIVDTVGSAWDDVILPVVGDVIDYLQALLGRPNCNGEVFHDLVLFEPSSAGTVQSWSCTYTAHSPDACGQDPHTAVRYTRERAAESSGEFGHNKPPRVDAKATHDEPVETWCGVWAENPTSSAPHIQVSIQPVPIGFGTQPSLMAVTIREEIETATGGLFELAAPVVSPEALALPLYAGDVFGTVMPHVDVSAHPLGSRLAMLEPAPGGPVVQQQVGLLPTTPHNGSISMAPEPSDVGGIDEPNAGMVSVDALVLADGAVRLSLYTASADGDPIAHLLRYTRAKTDQYTYTDVMLARWTPV